MEGVQCDFMRGNNNVGKAAMAVIFGLGGAYTGFLLQERFLEERRVAKRVEDEAQRRFRLEMQATSQQ
ncbi:hypothetical protein SPRG_14965 [Saprolegnia parasitica CBS 223.65]|uniref:Uncharacterized protein n=1 Tax=Saprolegnia parasitica (strain CBS 223.65) TaxID=695850 RepID=A0A067BLQ2_SAPPC|nr:hypothetical protein SPRG_14965 [Saprolegnia parasitica CBS 223.65]KDO19133.1 hypothetical protein SPRG_14965 [Saprolegnia parasitica CBS 223.65]|eukprot:XP_012210166.1 hypothetical protein SPRG_14965 [Saprolegnia parasitica CBS 223.65]